MPKSKVRKKKKNRSSSPPPPPVKKERGPSPTWYVALMFGLMALGMAIIILNYMGLLGTANNLKLVIGLAGIAVGFGMTLNFH